MGRQPSGPSDWAIERLTPARFEVLAFLLAHADDARVVPIKNKDHGLDARLPNAKGQTLRGWQAKRYTGAINWGECHGSVTRALAFWRPPRITFVFVRDLSATEQESFRTELIEKFPEVRLDFWSGSEVQRRMRDTDEGRRAVAWLFEHDEITREDMLRAVAVGGELATTEQAAERQAVIQKFMDRDPHLHYTTVSRSPQAPKTPPAPETLLSVIFERDGQEIRFDAAERYSGALTALGGAPEIVFSDDAEGELARETLNRLARKGGSARIESGLGTRMPEVPLGLRGLLPEEGIWGPAEVTTVPASGDAAPEAEGTAVIVCCGGHELGMVLRPAPPPPGWDVTLAGAAGGLEVFQSAKVLGEEVLDLTLDWRHRFGEGTALEQLLACRILLAGLRGDAVEIRLPGEPKPMAVGTMNPPASVADDLASLQASESYLGFVAEVEAWLGEPLPASAEPSDEDWGTLSWLVPQIRQPENEGSWVRVDVDAREDVEISDEPVQIILMQARYARLFGTEHFIGIERVHLPAAIVRHEGTETWVEPPVAPGKAAIELHHPDEAGPEAAAPRI